MPRYAEPVPVPPARKGASSPGAVRPQPGRAVPRQGLLWHAIQLKAARSAASAPAAKPSPRSDLPAPLQAGIEQLSGIAMDDVRVHRNSPEPARLGAFAYTQGSDIHLGPGQERHLAHEAWHVVQQKQGRVTPTHQLKSVGINADPALESEADAMGARALANPAPSDVPLAEGRAAAGIVAPVQCVWRIIANGPKSVVFWRDEGEGPNPTTPKPSAWAAFAEQKPPSDDAYYLAENKSQRGKEPALTLAQWSAQQFGSATRGPSDSYNPFGRFTTGSISSFVPSPEMPQDRYKTVCEELTKSDKSFQPYSPDITRQFQEEVKKKEPNAAFHNELSYPRVIATDKGKLLRFVSATTFGATYSDKVPGRSSALHDPNKVIKAPLKWADEVKDISEFRQVSSSLVDPDTLKAWHGKERSKQQHEVMGASARQAAENAGFDPDEGEGWEWLHLIAHSMGGIDLLGPQVPGNLVAGTSECNTQMIVVEEFLKDIVNRTGGKAKLHVFVAMFDAARHVGKSIHYDFNISDKLGNPISVYHWVFDCLTRTNPLVSENRELRYVGRGAFGLGGKSDPPKGFEFGYKSKYDPSSEPGKPKGGGLEANELARTLAALSNERRAQIAVQLGRDASANAPVELAAALAEQVFDVVLAIMAASSLGVPGTQDVEQKVDNELLEMGLVRKSSTMTGFICLIDSIRQLLAARGLPVDANQLIAAVQQTTGRNLGQMLEIIGDEGKKVMQAVDAVVFATHNKHIKLVADVLIVMPDGSIVPFYNANSYAAQGGEEVELRLLFVNNNHYEPLFDAAMDTS
jgi:hypothetical protein